MDFSLFPTAFIDSYKHEGNLSLNPYCGLFHPPSSISSRLLNVRQIHWRELFQFDVKLSFLRFFP